MVVVSLIAFVLRIALLLYLAVLFVRLIYDYIPLFSRGWRPRGIFLIIAEIAYTLTDPPIKMFRRFIPPVRVGSLALDFGFTFTMLLVLILLSVVSAFL